MTKKLFKKGDKAFLVKNWDGKFTTFIREVIISSWGNARATAIYSQDGQNLKEQIFVDRVNLSFRSLHVLRADADVEAFATQLAEQIRLNAIEQYKSQIDFEEKSARSSTKYIDQLKTELDVAENTKAGFIYLDQWREGDHSRKTP